MKVSPGAIELKEQHARGSANRCCPQDREESQISVSLYWLSSIRANDDK